MVSAVRQRLIGPRVRARRTALELTQAALAERAGISTSYLNLIENNKRPVAGRLQIALAEALDIDISALSGAAEQQLTNALSLAAADPALGSAALTPADAAELVGHYPEWARLTARAVAAYREQASQTVALTDRLAHDPVIANAVHQMLTNIAAVRSTAEILTSVQDLPPEQLQRFHAIIEEQSSALTDASGTLAAVFDPTNTHLRPVTSLDVIEDAFARRQNRLPALEDAVTHLRARLHIDAEATGAIIDQALAGHWKSLGLKIDSTGTAMVPSQPSPSTLSLPRAAPAATNRAFLALKLLERVLANQVETELSGELTPDGPSDAPPLAIGSPAATDLRAAFVQYAADALLMPYGAFLADAVAWRFDIAMLAASYDVDVAAAARRLTTLQHGGAPAFAMLAVNPSGARLDRRRTTDVAMPRFGAGCALWAIHSAFNGTERAREQIIEMPTGERLWTIAIAMSAPGKSADAAPPRRAYMLATPAIHAGTFSGEDTGHVPSVAAGITCELCPRGDCAYRAAAPILAEITGKA